ncbi:hypothetical protein PaelaDRAFT_0424 [Paenibacillus lactis 154]|uniref:Uncharacterized protein n=1 Tax=Paenibacillus lactis 154 TaxID=743719 RepID=G4H8W3_9BACL|nr:hypothetical protein PaelaDRAFT_0424 [Paenibacillus lactis 154]
MLLLFYCVKINLQFYHASHLSLIIKQWPNRRVNQRPTWHKFIVYKGILFLKGVHHGKDQQLA